MNSSVPIEAGGIIPVSQSDVANIPAIALSIPDFEGQAISQDILKFYSKRNWMLFGGCYERCHLFTSERRGHDLGSLHTHCLGGFLCYGRLWESYTYHPDALRPFSVNICRFLGSTSHLLHWCVIDELAQCTSCLLEQLCVECWHDLYTANAEQYQQANWK